MVNIKTIKKLSSLGVGDPLEIVTPKNMLNIKKAYMEGQLPDNPVYEYDLEALKNKAAAKGELEKVLADADVQADDFLAKIVRRAIEKEIAKAELAGAIATGDNVVIGEAMRKNYEPPSDNLISVAEGILRGEDKLSDELLANIGIVGNLMPNITYDAEGIAEVFRAALKCYGFTGWAVRIDDSHAAITVSALAAECPTIFIPTSREVDRVKLATLIGHEIESHVRHYENCAHVFEQLGIEGDAAYLIASSALSSDLTEGFAKIADAVIGKMGTGENSGAPLPWYTLAAAKFNEGASFLDVVAYLGELGRKGKSAWSAVYRTTRGYIKTASIPFANTSGLSYLRGFAEAIELRQKFEHAEDFGRFDEFELEELEKLDIKPKYTNLHLGEKFLVSNI